MCDCYTDGARLRSDPPDLRIHLDPQDTRGEAWRWLLDLIEETAADHREELVVVSRLGRELYRQIVTLPPTIARLKSVRHLVLYGSNLSRIPPEIGGMSSLEELDIYTSYRLHWLPCEITRCPRLRKSRVSTRALYGNWKHRPPFPRLPQHASALSPARCSVCCGPLGPQGPLQRWITLRVATDAMPLLVHACSPACLAQLQTPPDGYAPGPHEGGPVDA